MATRKQARREGRVSSGFSLPAAKAKVPFYLMYVRLPQSRLVGFTVARGGTGYTGGVERQTVELKGRLVD